MNPEQQAQLEALLPFFAQLAVSKRYVSTAPTYTPKNLIEQFVLYKNGATYRLYVWFGPSEGWHYLSLT